MEENDFDVVIVGAGPAGLSAAIYALRSGLKVAAIESRVPGGYLVFVEKLENYPGFQSISGMDLAKRLVDQAKALGLKIFQDEVLAIQDNGKKKLVKAKKREFLASAVIVASGSVPKELDVKGAKELKGNGLHYCAVCDGPVYSQKNVFVFGNNNAAAEEAVFLSKIAKTVTVVSQDEDFVAAAVLKKQVFEIKNIKLLSRTEILELVGKNSLEKIVLKNANGKNETVAADALFVYIGRKPSTGFVSVEKNAAGLIIVGRDMATSAKGIFAAGDCTEKPLRQTITAVSDGAIAAIKAKEFIQSNS